MFARYGLIGAMSSAGGALAAAIPDFLTRAGLSELTAIKAMFVVYALLGVTGAVLYARIPRRLPAMRPTPRTALGPSRNIVYKLAATLFSLDAFAGGFVVQSLLAFWLFSRASICRSRRRACSSFGPASSRHSRFRSPRPCPSVSDW
jgi:hypothetical protein